VQVEHVKLSKKILYHFAKFTIVNELLTAREFSRFEKNAFKVFDREK